MKTRAVRIYGKNDLRLEEYDLPAIRNDEILAKVVCDSLCMSSYKAAKQGSDHKRIPNDISQNPTIIGHEFAGELLEIGEKWKNDFFQGQKFSVQPAIYNKNGPVGILSAPGYSYRHIGGDATYIIIPNDVIEQDCLLPYTGEGYYPASLAEPLSCVIGAMHANYHTDAGSYYHKMEILNNGNMALLAGGGPMGLAATAYSLNRNDIHPRLLVVTDIDSRRLKRANMIFSPEKAKEKGINLIYVNASEQAELIKYLRNLTNNSGFDDVFIFSPVSNVIEQGDVILARDGCLNFFAGPEEIDFKACLNFYNVHYNATHIVGTSGGNMDDMKEALKYLSTGLNLSGLVTHIGGLSAVIDATLNLPTIPGGKKLIYTQIEMPLIATDDFEKYAVKNDFFAELDRICKSNNSLWSVEAENFLLANKISRLNLQNL